MNAGTELIICYYDMMIPIYTSWLPRLIFRRQWYYDIVIYHSVAYILDGHWDMAPFVKRNRKTWFAPPPCVSTSGRPAKIWPLYMKS